MSAAGCVLLYPLLWPFSASSFYLISPMHFPIISIIFELTTPARGALLYMHAKKTMQCCIQVGGEQNLYYGMRPLSDKEWMIPLHHPGLKQHSSPVPCEKRKESAAFSLWVVERDRPFCMKAEAPIPLARREEKKIQSQFSRSRRCDLFLAFLRPPMIF